MHVRLIGDSKIVLRSECERVCGRLSRLSLCGPVMDWRPVQGVPRLSPDDRWNRLQPPRDPTEGLSRYGKWMDGWMDSYQKPIAKLLLSLAFYSNSIFSQVCFVALICLTVNKIKR